MSEKNIRLCVNERERERERERRERERERELFYDLTKIHEKRLLYLMLLVSSLLLRVRVCVCA